MKNISNKGFVLAETLVVAVFLMTIFSMIYYYFYPLIGEYEKREVYDSVDDKYSIYWIKRMIEDSSYTMKITEKKKNFDKYGYVRFECSDVTENYDKKQMCVTLVKSLEARNCDKQGDGCDIFLTKYTIGGSGIFKDKVKNNPNLKRYEENCSSGCTVEKFADNMCKNVDPSEKTKCKTSAKQIAQRKVFDSGLKDYIDVLPDYTAGSPNGAGYRVIAIFRHKKDGNNYDSYATIEVNRQ